MRFRFHKLLVLLVLSYNVCSQTTISIDESKSDQQLAEEVLINSSCANVSNVTVSGGNFTDGSHTYASFDQNGSTFPFSNGIILSTGKAKSAAGPNDVNIPLSEGLRGWAGDTDLENALGVTNTRNATILEFDFTPIANQISFDYIFASEEYTNDPCNFSDGFAFLLKQNGTNDSFTNLAVIPNTNTPVGVTTVHPDLTGCPAMNKQFFDTFNDNNAPIAFDGQTVVLTASASVTPNVSYHIKLVIADQGDDDRFDSAIFIAGGSFSLGTNLGLDRISANNNQLCPGDTLLLSADTGVVGTLYQWSKDGAIIQGETGPTFLVTEEGIYSVAVTLGINCSDSDSIEVRFSNTLPTQDTDLFQCDDDGDGLTIYDLRSSISKITSDNPALTVTNFFLTLNDAQNDINPIPNPDRFQNTVPNQVVYARVINGLGCSAVAEITLKTLTNASDDALLEVCDNDGNPDGFHTFHLPDANPQLLNGLPTGITVSYYLNETDALLQLNPLPDDFTNTVAFSQTLYARLSDSNGCFAISLLQLKVNIPPQIVTSETLTFCLGFFPNSVTIGPGIPSGDFGNYTYLWSTGETTPTITVTQAGIYTVVVFGLNGCDSTRTVTLQEVDNQANNAVLEVCDDDGTADGFYIFTLSDADAQVLGGLTPPSNFSVSYYLTREDALSAINQLPDPYINTTPFNQIIYSRVENGTVCYSIGELTLIVNDLPVIQTSEDINICADIFVGPITLNPGVPVIQFGDFTYLWSTGETTPTIDVSTSGVFTVRVFNVSGCFDTKTVRVNIIDNTANDAVLEVCDDDGTEDGSHLFTLSDADSLIFVGQPNNLSIKYYLNEQDALDQKNALSDQFINTVPEEQVLIARLDNGAGCFATSKLTLIVNPLPDIITAETVQFCSASQVNSITLNPGIFPDQFGNFTYLWSTGETTPTIEVSQLGVYNVTVSNSFGCSRLRAITVQGTTTVDTIDIIRNGISQTDLNLCEGEGHTLMADDIAGATYIWEKDGVILPETGSFFILSNADSSTAGLYKVTIDSNNGLCPSIGQANVNVTILSNLPDVSLIQCDDNKDGLTIYDLNIASDKIIGNNSSLTITGFFLSTNDADNNIAISNSDRFLNTSPNQIVYARVESAIGCSRLVQISLEISTNIADDAVLEVCDDDGNEDGLHVFTLTDADSQVLKGFPAGLSVRYYLNFDDAQLEQNALPDNFTNTQSGSQVLYARISDGPDCSAISQLRLTINPLPKIDTEKTLVFCTNSSTPILLTPGIPINQFADFTYRWSTGETTPTIEINQAGTFTVQVFNNFGCFKTRTVTVNPSNPATIREIIVNDTSDNNTIEIVVSGQGDYEFSIDNIEGPYQDESTFDHVQSGFHTVFVRDKNGCGIVSREVAVIGIPKFFTPNGDGFHETWQVKGLPFELRSGTKIFIFDRFGKLLKDLSPNGPGWDGIFNGNLMPSTDYWYRIELGDGRTLKGNFTLKR